MKIVQINAVCGTGSTGRICRFLSRMLCDRGVENCILYTSGHSDDANGIRYMSTLSVKAGALASRIDGRDGFHSVKATRRLIDHLDRIRPDTVHLHNLHGHNVNLDMLLSYLKEHRTRTFWTFHDCWAFTGYCCHYDMAGCDGYVYGCGRCPLWRQHSWFCDRSRELFQRKRALTSGLDLHIVMPSRWMARQVERSFLADHPLYVVPNGIDLSVFRPTPAPEFRAAFHLEGQHILLGVASTWNDGKGLDVMIDMADRLPPDCRLVLVGGLPAGKKRLPSTVVTVPHTDSPQTLAGIYTEADVFLNPTREDTYPTVNMEAIACGTPVVTFDTGGSPEMLTPDCGAVVPKNDNEAMLREALHAVRGAYRQTDCTAHAADFDRETCFAAYLGLWGVTP